MSELEDIKKRYTRRQESGADSVYNVLAPSTYMARQEKERALVRWIKAARLTPVSNKSVLEVGCGGGASLNQLLRLGFSPENVVGVELIPEYAKRARHNLPSDVQIIEGDALEVGLPVQGFDIVLQSTVFTSILDDEYQEKLAHRMWTLAKRGGGILWYDFAYNNPWNHDVRGVPLTRIKALFPKAKPMHWRVTLAPPLSRRVTKIHASLYGLFNLLPFLRSHLLCWIERPVDS